MRADNSHLIIAAAARRAAATRRRATAALRRMDTTGTAISFETVAREAGVSRSWLYNQPDLRAEIERLRTRTRHRVPAARPVPDRQRASDASLLRRLESATRRNQQLETENRELREALALALGERRTADLTRRPGDTPRKKISGPSSAPAEWHVDDTVHHASVPVGGPRDRLAQDNGRKRGLAVDVLGLVIAVTVLAANTHDNAAGIALLDQVAEHTGGTVQKALVDQGFKNQVVAHGTVLGIDVEIVRTQPAGQGVRPAAEAVEGRADLRDPDTAPAPGPRLRTPPGLLRLPRLLGDDPHHDPPAHRREHPHLARPAGR